MTIRQDVRGPKVVSGKRNVSLLPGRACRHYLRGACLLQERTNPGYHRNWRCMLLSRMEDEYDRLLAQADVFELDEETAARILEGRLKGILPGERVCRDYSPGEDELTGCLSGFRGVCLRRLPPCPGVCEKFEPGTCKRQSGKE